jgi:hypothetical protein
MEKEELYRIKKKYQQQLNRYYSTNAPSPLIAEAIGTGRDWFHSYIDKHMQEGMTYQNYGRV